MHSMSPLLESEMSMASGKIRLDASRFLARSAESVFGTIFLAASWLDSKMPAAIAGACGVSKTTSTDSSPDEAIMAIHPGFSAKAVSTVFATMRFVFIFLLAICATVYLAHDGEDKETA